MKTSSSHRASRVPAAPQRFCWRERTEKVNWRMLHALHLPDVIKRGDPSVLEPYVLHLTFARLPVSAASVAGADAMENVHRGANRYPYDEGDGKYDQRNAWFIVRIFQLATEYLLFMRSRDGTVLETMQKELELCERATPSSVATIGTLLTELIPRPKKRNSRYGNANGDGGEGDPPYDSSDDEQRRIKEARQCFYCGKVFASVVYLEKHHLRRHPGEDREVKLKEFPKYTPRQHTNSTSVSIEDNESREKVLQQMLLQVEHTLQDHQESLRSLAKEEAAKIQRFYEQLHAENQLAEEIKASRMHAETRVEEAQRQLDTILREKEDAVAQLRDLKEQIQFLDLKRKMEIQSGVHTSALSASSGKPDISMTLEIERLEQTLGLVNSTLAESREELRRLQETHLTTLKEKQKLGDQLDQSQSHAKRLEQAISEWSGAQSIPVPRNDCSTQTLTAGFSKIGVQTIAETETQPKLMPEKTDAANQTDPDVKVSAIEIGIQTDSDETVPVLHPNSQPDPNQDAATTSETRNTPEVTASGDAEKCSSIETLKADTPTPVSDYMFNLISESVMDAVTARAQRSLDDLVSSSLQASSSNKRFSSLSKRAYLRSRYQHDESIVKQRIEDHVRRLEQISQRFGIPPKCNLLSNEHLQIVQQALHGHLEILPTDVLQKMIDCDGAVNSIIEKEWIPREKTRQLALDRLKAETHAKSQRNQDLVKLAMLSFASASDLVMLKQTPVAEEPSSLTEERKRTAHVEVDIGPVESSNSSVATERNQPAPSNDGASENTKPRFNVNGLTVIIEEKSPPIETGSDKVLGLRLLENMTESIKDEQLGVAENMVSEPVQPKSDASSSSEETDSRILNQQPDEEIKIRSMRMVTVSPRTSPAKPNTGDDNKGAKLQSTESSPATADIHTNTSYATSTHEEEVQAEVIESQASEATSPSQETNSMMIQSAPDAISVEIDDGLPPVNNLDASKSSTNAMRQREDEGNEIETYESRSDLHAQEYDMRVDNSQGDIVEVMEILEIAGSPSMRTNDTYDRSDTERSDQPLHSRSF
ncbi:hypothetical protein FI667_g12557, partial [Globisporangium splendens]